MISLYTYIFQGCDKVPTLNCDWTAKEFNVFFVLNIHRWMVGCKRSLIIPSKLAAHCLCTTLFEIPPDFFAALELEHTHGKGKCFFESLEPALNCYWAISLPRESFAEKTRPKATHFNLKSCTDSKPKDHWVIGSLGDDATKKLANREVFLFVWIPWLV